MKQQTRQRKNRPCRDQARHLGYEEALGAKQANRQRQGETLNQSLRALQAPSLEQLQPGTVVLAQIPYADGTGWKTRPAVVISAETDRVQVLPATTVRRDQYSCVQLHEWADAGLTRPTYVQERSVEVERKTEITSVRGRLSDRDWLAVEALAACLS